jgi:hypothetical protein
MEDNRHSSTYTEAENLARNIISRMDSVTAKLKSLEDDIRKLWVEFDKLKAGETILGCATKKEFCERKLNRTPQAVRYMLNPELRTSKQCLLPELRHSESADEDTEQDDPGAGSVAAPNSQAKARVTRSTTQHLDPESPVARAAQKIRDQAMSGHAPENGALAKLFMKVDRLLPQNHSFFSEGADSPERSFPQMVEDAVAGVQPKFTIAYNTFGNVYRHEQMHGGKIVKTYTAAQLADVLDKAAASLTDAAARIRNAAKATPTKVKPQRKPGR